MAAYNFAGLTICLETNPNLLKLHDSENINHFATQITPTTIPVTHTSLHKCDCLLYSFQMSALCYQDNIRHKLTWKVEKDDAYFCTFFYTRLIKVLYYMTACNFAGLTSCRQTNTVLLKLQVIKYLIPLVAQIISPTPFIS